jgi:hypothetical protein
MSQEKKPKQQDLSSLKFDIFIVIGISVASTAIAECRTPPSVLISTVLSYILVYRSATYKQLKRSIENAALDGAFFLCTLMASVEKKKAVAATKAGADKDLKKAEKDLADLNQRFTSSKLKGMFATAVSLIGVFQTLNHLYSTTPAP